MNAKKPVDGGDTARTIRRRPLVGVDRTSLVTPATSAFDPKQTSLPITQDRREAASFLTAEMRS
jgi:hypothetical protein